MKSKKQTKSMFFYEHKYQKEGHKYIAGVDEVGRGCWAGPVVACACILPAGYENPAIKDSKVLSIKKREELDKIIKQNCIAYAIAYVDAPRIDIINIKEAAKEAMVKALNNLKIKPTCVLVDAEDIKFGKATIVPIVKGDAKSTSIAAASIIAKVYRDKILDDLDKQYPQFGFAKNKGYGTQVHLNALKQYGPVKSIHRFSYKPVKATIKK